MLETIAPSNAARTVKEVAALIHYHEESLRRAIRQGRVRALPFGNGWRIPETEVARILTEGLPYRAAKGKRK